MEEILVDDPSVTLTIRLIMQGKEVGSIIGKKGEIVKRFREESGAKINISDGSCPERIVTVSGSTKAIFRAFSRITRKFEDWCSQFSEVPGGKAQIPIRLIVPASQCGSLIGKGGSKIKEIREVTGCSIQVASEMLPNSTERAVTLNGSADQITQCIYHICCVMLESPPKGATIPYRPKPQVNGPVILSNGQAYTIQGNFAIPAQEMSGLTKNPLAGLAAVGLAGMAPANTGGLNPVALAALAGSQLRTANTTRSQQTNAQQYEMTVPNDLIGCIIGKGGTKIAEIRQISGAMIRISNCEEREGGNTDRTITISGNPDAVAVAQYLINMSVELQKANLTEDSSSPSSSTSGSVAASTVNAVAAAAAAAAAVAANGNGTAGSLSAVGPSPAHANCGGGVAAAAAVLGLANGSNGHQQHGVVQSPPSLVGAHQQQAASPQSLLQQSASTSLTTITQSTTNSNSNSSSNNCNTNLITKATATTCDAAATPAALVNAIPLAQLLAKPGALNALNSITALSGLSDFLGGFANLGGAANIHRSTMKSVTSPRYRNAATSSATSTTSSMGSNSSSGSGDGKKSDRNKFNPY